jgi:hypothetical protein
LKIGNATVREPYLNEIVEPYSKVGEKVGKLVAELTTGEVEKLTKLIS